MPCTHCTLPGMVHGTPRYTIPITPNCCTPSATPLLPCPCSGVYLFAVDWSLLSFGHRAHCQPNFTQKMQSNVTLLLFLRISAKSEWGNMIEINQIKSPCSRNNLTQPAQPPAEPFLLYNIRVWQKLKLSNEIIISFVKHLIIILLFFLG